MLEEGSELYSEPDDTGRWHGFRTPTNVMQVYETTISDAGSGLSAHLMIVPARSLGGESYLFSGADWPLETLGLTRMADVPLGGVAHSLAACLISRDADEFWRRFQEGFEKESAHGSVHPPDHFAFAEYLTFARVIPFEWPSFGADSLGNILTAQGRGEAGYMYHQETQAPLLGVAIPAGIVICGSTTNLTRALEAGLRRDILNLLQPHSQGQNAAE